ncbi:hypothetical protein AA0119_g13127 [Alternaria tenuissima]|uniref:Dol-P-Man:Man(5)GlcNAc(2)-PP-Dol alpha-1,3-mannosyltransferase n=2 Tax=Alternaria alternata complex TaxID=187734 RepID=A0A4V1WPK2_ALTAL|nr:hypothetical protein AA0117_g12978 [Alternaria alternata]RYN85779.1 hypothetical protein AA0119_g13127 [Alternaria tenuissima]RYO03583.1 hypothetical protein AA0121_g13025 [Alternaria tenuissima]RYO48032.1 hypothetical protein AA0116_g12886 [Alternaria tenuissima]
MPRVSRRLQAMIEPPHPPAPAVVDTLRIQRMFHRREQEARAKGLSRSSWLALTTATVIGVDSEASMTALYHHATASTNLEESVAVAELMREIGLRGIAVVCIPQIMDMLAAFRASLPSVVRSSLSTTPLGCADADIIESINQEGEELWNAIHHPKGRVIERKLVNAHPDLANYVKGHVYGGLLARHRSPTVGRITISLCAIACLRASRPSSRQLQSHVHGLKKAWEDGSWRSDPGAGLEEGIRWLTSDEGCMWVLEVVDELVLAITSGRAAGPAMTVAKL